ncbi:MAG: preprotein translocase subunit SecG [bacterium]|nr:preprotein translocase subunit SecG [bacterium]
MNMIFIAQIIISVLLTSLILLQGKGVGLAANFGGEGSFYRTKRGFEKLIYFLTIVLSIIFLTTSLYGLVKS